MLSSFFHLSPWSILFWIFVGIAIGGLLSWLLSSAASTTVSEVDEGPNLSLLEGRKVLVREERTELADQLEAIEGIGPQISELLNKNGVHRFAQVAGMSSDEIRKILKSGGSRFDLADPTTWPLQARLLANGWIVEHFDLRGRLRAGRADLMGVSGIGSGTAERLAAGGVGSLHALSAAKAPEVAAMLEQAGEPIAPNVVAEWIEQAKAAVAGDPLRIAAIFGVPAAALAFRQAPSFTEHREVTGALVDARSLGDVFRTRATAVATAKPSLLPFWIGLIGAALLALLSLLGLLGHKPTVPELPAAPSLPAPGVTALSAELGTDTAFSTSSAVLTDAGKADIDSKIIEPARNLDLASIRIVGHADVRGDDAMNLKLSRDRAQSVADYIREKVRTGGIKWNPRVIEVYGAGEQFPNPAANTEVDCKPLNPTSDEASRCYAPDRRVDVTIIAKGAAAAVEAAKAKSEAAP